MTIKLGASNAICQQFNGTREDARKMHSVLDVVPVM